MWSLGEKQQLPFVALFIYTPCKCNKVGGGGGGGYAGITVSVCPLSYQNIYVDHVTVGNRIGLFKSKPKVMQGELLRWFVLYLYQYTE